MLKKLLRLNADDLLLCGIVGGVFLVTHVITFVALNVFGAGSSLLISGVLLPVVAGILILMCAVSHTAVTFVQAIQFGQTRKRALGLALGVIAVQSAVIMGLAALLAWLERLFAPSFWLWLSGANALAWGDGGRVLQDYSGPGWALFIEDFSIAWWGYPAIALGAAAVGILIAAFLLRFGRRGIWLLWGIWLAGLVGFQLLPWKTHTIVDWLMPMLGVSLLAGLVWSFWSLLRTTIKS